MSKKTTKRPPIFIVTKDRSVVPYNVLDNYAIKQKSKAMLSDVFKTLYQKNKLIAPLYNLETLARLPEINAVHFRCVKTKATDTAGLGWGLTPVESEDKSSPENKKKLMDFFNNQELPLEIILTAVMTDFESVGAGSLEIVREDDKADGEPVVMSQVPSHTIRVHSSLEKYCQVRGIKKVWFKRAGLKDKDIDIKTGEIVDAGQLKDSAEPGSELVYIKNYTSRSDYYGLPDIIPALGAVEGHISQRDYNINFFRNFGIPSYAVSITGDFDLGEPDKDGEYAVVKTIRGHLDTIVENPHAPLVLAVPSRVGDKEGKAEIKFEPLSISIKEGHFRLYRKDNIEEILSAHGVPPYRAGIAVVGALGGSTAKESTEIYKTSVINPKQQLLSQVITKYVIRQGFGIEDWEFYLEEIDISDEKHDKEIAEFLFERGAMTPNQLIAYFGERFGIKPDDSLVMLNWHYMKGEPLETADLFKSEIVESVKELHERMLELVQKSK